MISYIALDPGEKRIGYATFNSEGTALDFGTFTKEDEMLDWLESDDIQPEVIIVESYRARPGAINSWSRLPTVQQVGAIKRIARKKKILVIEQDPSPCLAMGLRFLGMHKTYKNKHVPDQVSALAHGVYYLRKHRILK